MKKEKEKKPKKDVLINMRITSEEKAFWEEYCEDRELKGLSTLIREAVNYYIENFDDY